jgi:hypothetical protein
MKTEDIEKAKDVQYYAACVNAWHNSALEHDKNLLTLSSGGIGLLITLLNTVGASSCLMVSCYVIAIFAFLVCLTSVLIIFKRNRKYIEQIINNNKEDKDDILSVLDYIAIISFGIGVLFSGFIGILAAFK